MITFFPPRLCCVCVRWCWCDGTSLSKNWPPATQMEEFLFGSNMRVGGLWSWSTTAELRWWLFFFFLNNSSIKWTFLLQFKDRFYFIGAHCPTSMRAKMWFTAGHVSCVLFSVLCRWVTSPGPTTAPRLSSRTVTALSWWGQSVARDTGPPRSTWKVRSPVVSGRLMTSR